MVGIWPTPNKRHWTNGGRVKCSTLYSCRYSSLHFLAVSSNDRWPMEPARANHIHPNYRPLSLSHSTPLSRSEKVPTLPTLSACVDPPCPVPLPLPSTPIKQTRIHASSSRRDARDVHPRPPQPRIVITTTTPRLLPLPLPTRLLPPPPLPRQPTIAPPSHPRSRPSRSACRRRRREGGGGVGGGEDGIIRRGARGDGVGAGAGGGVFRFDASGPRAAAAPSFSFAEPRRREAARRARIPRRRAGVPRGRGRPEGSD